MRLMRPVLWAIGAVLVVAVGVGLGMLVAGALMPEHQVLRFTLAAGVSTAVAGMGAWVLARSLDPGTGPWSRAATTLLLLGTAVTAITTGALVSWTEERFVYFDPEYVGPTLLLPLAMLMVAIGVVVRRASRSGIRTAATAVLLIGGAACLIIVGLNLPGLWDGIEQQSWGLALAVAAAVVYTLTAVGATLGGRFRRRTA